MRPFPHPTLWASPRPSRVQASITAHPSGQVWWLTGLDAVPPYSTIADEASHHLPYPILPYHGKFEFNAVHPFITVTDRLRCTIEGRETRSDTGAACMWMSALPK